MLELYGDSSSAKEKPDIDVPMKGSHILKDKGVYIISSLKSGMGSGADRICVNMRTAEYQVYVDNVMLYMKLAT